MVENLVNLLLGMPGAMDIPRFKERLEQFVYWDRFFVRYYKSVDAYRMIRDYFLSHSEFTHLAIFPDDLLAEYEDVRMLIEAVKVYDYPVISGLCNVYTFLPHLAAVSMTLPSMEREGREYNWLPYEDIREAKELIKVEFIGFPLPIIRRDVVEKIKFRADLEGPAGCCLDVTFSHDCHDNNIPLYVHPDIMMYHMNRQDWSGDMTLWLGIKEPEIYFKSKNQY